MIFLDPAINLPQKRTRYLCFDHLGWCIGDCFFGYSQPDYWNMDLSVRVPRIGWEKECWRYSESENVCNLMLRFTRNYLKLSYDCL